MSSLIPFGIADATCEGGLCEMPAPLPALTLISTPTCPYVQRAAIALKERGMDFKVIYIDLNDKPEWFLALSPLGKVPVLKVEREGQEPAILFESTVILQYLDETLPGSRLFPEDALARARQRAWIEYAGSLLGDLYRLGQTKDEASWTDALTAVENRLRPLEAEVEGPFFAGEDFSAVDVVYAPAFRQIDSFETLRPLGVLKGFPALNRWRQALAARPSVQDAVPADFNALYLGRLRASDAYLTRKN